MNEEEKFKEELNRLMESKSFDFDEANWNKAKKMMTKPNPWLQFLKQPIVLSSILILLLVSGVSYLLISKQASNVENKIASETKFESNAMEQNENFNIEKLNIRDTDQPKSDATISKNKTEIEVKANELFDEKTISKNTDATISEASDNSAQNKVLPISSIDKQSNRANAIDDKEEKTASKRIISDTPIANNTRTTIEAERSSIASIEEHEQKKTKSTSRVSKSDRPVIATKSINDNQQSKIVREVEPTDVLNATKAIEPVSVNKTTKYKLSKGDKNTDLNASVYNDSKSRNALFYNDSNRPFVRKIYANLAFDSINDISKILQPVSIDSTTYYNRMRPKIKHVVSLEAGTTYLFGWKDNQGKDANGFNPIIGLNYAYQFNQHLSISLGIQYTSVGNIRNTDYTAKRIKYNFGEEIDYTTISAKTMYYLMWPMKLSYHLNAKNEIGTGLNFAYLLDVNSNVATYSKRFNTISPAVNAKSNGYKGGFSPLDAQLALFYRRRLASRLSIHSEFLYGVVDIKNDLYFKPVSFDRNIGLKLTLLYDVFKK
jgi:hypothetical protein